MDKLYSIEDIAEAMLTIPKDEDEETSKDEVFNDESDEEVDLEVELLYALEEIEKCRRKKISLKGQLSKYQEELNSKEEEVKTLQEEMHNSRQQAMVSMKEV